VHKLASEEQSPACLLVFCPQLALDAILPFRMISNTESRTAERQNGRMKRWQGRKRRAKSRQPFQLRKSSTDLAG